MNRNANINKPWTLTDLVEFEAALARANKTQNFRRDEFVVDAKPKLESLRDSGQRCRAGLHLWLEAQRAAGLSPTRQLITGLFTSARWLLAIGMFLSAAGLTAGLLLGKQQSVNCVVFLSLTLVLPWLTYVAGLLLRYLLPSRSRLLALLQPLLRLLPSPPQRSELSHAFQALNEAKETQPLVTATLVKALQFGAIAFNVGLIVTFVGCLLFFDVNFYWETTAGTGMQSLLVSATQTLALPWSGWWPQALPSADVISATRALAGQLPAASSGSWWQFLLMCLLVWGLLPRLLLWFYYRHQQRYQLAKLRFQSRRHRQLWRLLDSIESGETSSGPVDGVLVLDVGGHGITGKTLRSFLLNRLRVHPLATRPIEILDQGDEAGTLQRLSAGPAGVVLLVESWDLSPRRIMALYQKLRELLGTTAPIIWLVFSLEEGRPSPPTAADRLRWTRQVDDFGDPASQLVAYGY